MSISRRTTALCLVAAGVLTLAGMLATPWESEPTTSAILSAISADDAQGQIAALLLHFGYLLMVPAVFGLLGALREWGGRFRAIGGTLAVVGWATLPGMLVVDFYGIALVNELPLEQAVRVEDASQGMLGAGIIAMTGGLPAFLGLLLLLISAARARVVATWVPVLMLVSFVGPIALGNGLVSMAAGSVALLVVLAATARGVLAAGRPAPAAEVPAVREPVLA